jgi:hypothetical protein
MGVLLPKGARFPVYRLMVFIGILLLKFDNAKLETAPKGITGSWGLLMGTFRQSFSWTSKKVEVILSGIFNG